MGTIAPPEASSRARVMATADPHDVAPQASKDARARAADYRGAIAKLADLELER
jgi:hypothetical protein